MKFSPLFMGLLFVCTVVEAQSPKSKYDRAPTFILPHDTATMTSTTTLSLVDPIIPYFEWSVSSSQRIVAQLSPDKKAMTVYNAKCTQVGDNALCTFSQPHVTGSLPLSTICTEFSK